MRLRQLQQQFGEQIAITHRAFPLLADDQSRNFTPYYLQHRRAAREMTGLPYDLPLAGAHYPLSSMAALQAAKWVEANHLDRFDAYDLALYEAFFQHTRDISDPNVLADLAEANEMPGMSLAEALQSRAFEEVVWADHQEALQTGVNGIPAVLIGPYVLSGAVPFEDYEQATRAVLRDGHSGQEDSAAAAARPHRRPLRVR